MKSDEQIQQSVLEQLKWNQHLNSSEIGVSVKNGIVTLSGNVDSYLKKLEAERETKKVLGVKAIAEDIHVGVSPEFQKNDTEVAAAVLDALKWNTTLNEKSILVKVEDGEVTLEGEVEWQYQRDYAKNAIAHIFGVRNVINKLSLRSKVTPKDLKQRINAAFHRSASIDANKIQVDISGNRATLNGKVRSFTEKEDAEDAVWAAPGVLVVENNLEVEEEPELTF